MTSIEFGRLSDTNHRDAWPEDARDFTPWLFDNIGRLSEALNLDLEATDSEVAVDSFFADIVATETGTYHRILFVSVNRGYKSIGRVS